MARRDRINMTVPVSRENYSTWCIEPEIHINLATREISGYIRFAGQESRKFQKSVPFTVSISDNKLDNIVEHIVQRLVAQDGTLTGTWVKEEVADPEEDVSGNNIRIK